MLPAEAPIPTMGIAPLGVDRPSGDFGSDDAVRPEFESAEEEDGLLDEVIIETGVCAMRTGQWTNASFVGPTRKSLYVTEYL